MKTILPHPEVNIIVGDAVELARRIAITSLGFQLPASFFFISVLQQYATTGHCARLKCFQGGKKEENRSPKQACRFRRRKTKGLLHPETDHDFAAELCF